MDFDVLVIGGGHAGTEAAHASARMGCRTALATLNPERIGYLSCNPAMGGLAKGQLVKEIDALGGIMGRQTDKTAIQYRRLNTSKGPAVRSSRAQCDKPRYAKKMQEFLATVPNLSIIGLEVAASLRARGVDVDLVAPSGLGFERIFGPTLSAFIQRLHESHGVSFHLGASVKAIDATHVTLTSGKRLPADLVVVGIGVRPSVAVAQWARLEISQGIVVDDFLETSRPGIFAAGDVARWMTPNGEEAVAEVEGVLSQPEARGDYTT